MLQLSVVKFNRGTYIVVEGKEDANYFYIIQNGNVQCSKSTDSDAPVKYGPGDFIGVVPCMSGHAQIETAMALTDVTCISVRRDQYSELIANNTPLAIKIIRSFANRMRTMNEFLTKIAADHVSHDNPTQILSVAKYYESIGQYDIAVFAYYQYLKTKPEGPTSDMAKRKFVALKPRTHAVYFEPTAEASRTYPANTMIFSESQSGAEMYIIQEGQVVISKVVNGKEVTLAVLKQGDMFGEMALLENKPRSASAIAHTDCQVLVINRKNFDHMVSSQPQLISKLTVTLSERLWSMYRQIDNASLKEPLHKLVDMLSLQVEKQHIKWGAPGEPLKTDLTPTDLCNMCGIPQNHQSKAIYDLQTISFIKVRDGKLYISDCQEAMKLATLYKKQEAKLQQSDR